MHSGQIRCVAGCQRRAKSASSAVPAQSAAAHPPSADRRRRRGQRVRARRGHRHDVDHRVPRRRPAVARRARAAVPRLRRVDERPAAPGRRVVEAPLAECVAAAEAIASGRPRGACRPARRTSSTSWAASINRMTEQLLGLPSVAHAGREAGHDGAHRRRRVARDRQSDLGHRQLCASPAHAHRGCAAAPPNRWMPSSARSPASIASCAACWTTRARDG